jgi:ParB family chromosome partitioning protein
MVTELGGAQQVATYYDKTNGWVSQQRKLLKLTPPLQDLVSAGEMPVRIARDIAGLPAEVQAEAWKAELERRRVAKEAADRLRTDTAERPTPTAPEPPRFTAVNQAPPAGDREPAEEPSREVRFTAVNRQPETGPVHKSAVDQQPRRPAERSDVIPDPRDPHEPEDGQGLTSFPYQNGGEALMYLLRKMPPAERFKVFVGLGNDPETQAAKVG